MEFSEYRFDRLCRTPYSEAFTVQGADGEVGRLDLHFGQSVVYGSLVVTATLVEEEIASLVEMIDEDLVLAADTAREDFIITVYQGKQLGVYSDESFAESDEEEDEEEEEEEEENGGRRRQHRGSPKN